MGRNIVIYQDEGVGPFSLSCLQGFFKNDGVRLVNADAVIAGTAFDEADLFAIPGGADKPYARKLDGKGNTNIRSFVERGGTYLGVCAGAYYACKDIAFHKGREDEICADRELALIDATAIGSLPELAPFYNDTLHSANVIDILAGGKSIPTFYYGGCKFDLRDPDVKILAQYDIAGRPPAIVQKKVNKGRVLLSGVHFECNFNDLPRYPAADEAESLQGKSLSDKLRPRDFDWYDFLLGNEGA